jgi:c(7)-type cytochrome triheme protein
VSVLLLSAVLFAHPFHLPPRPPFDRYGNVLIRRGTANGSAKAVSFSHWSHRLRYTCRVCHLELDFNFKRNTTEITEEANRKGAFCGACHDGRTAFGHTEANCARCHTGDAATAADFARLSELPRSMFGNGVDWSRAIANGSIAPTTSLSKDFKPLTLDTTLSLEAEWNFVSPAVFPHADHVRWLDCANCHPAIFNVKKKTTKHFSMRYNLAGDFCGACHLRVAFPLDDCTRCHPEMKDQPLQ